MMLNEMKIVDLFELVKLLKGADKCTETKASQDNIPVLCGWSIVVLQRGWVVVGKLFKVGEYYKLENPAVIRVWGTNNGLPELVDGPLQGTKLDKSKRDFIFHELTVVLILEASDAWSKTLI